MVNKMKKETVGLVLKSAVLCCVFYPLLPCSANGAYRVDVTPYEKERRAIQIQEPDKYSATLDITPEKDCGWVLANSKIIQQDSALWYGPNPKSPSCHTYHLCDAFSSQEYVFIEGSLTKDGGGGGGSTPPPFWVLVPSVDIDWTGYGYETHGAETLEKYTAEKYEEGEDTRIVPIKISAERSLCSRFVINPPKDDRSIVAPMLELTWNYTSLIKIYDVNEREITSGTQFNAEFWGTPKTFYVVAQPDTSTHVVTFVLQGEADQPFEGRGPSSRPTDKILGLIPKITVDLDVDANYDGVIDDEDEPLEENPGGLVWVRDALNPGLTPMKLTLTSGASGIVWLRLTSGLGKVRVWENSTMTTLWDSTQPVRLGTLGVPKVFYLEGLVASSLMRDVQFEVDYTKADGTYTCADKIKLTVVKSDLDVDANYDGSISIADDPLEESAGGFTATNVLREIDLAAFPGPHKLTSGGVTLSAVAGGDKIKVWADPNKNTEVPLEKTWSVTSFPDKLYVEGIKASDTVRDIQLRLCYTNMTFSCRDEIKLTSVKVDLAEDPSQNYGFDPDGPWISVEKSKTTTVKVNIDPPSAASQVYFTSSDASKVTVQPSHASGSPQTLTLTAGSIEDDGATVDVRLGNASGLVCEQLGVAVYEKKSIQCFVHKVNGYAGSISLSEVNNLLKQAVVRIDSYAEDTRSCDLSAGYPYDVDNAEDEHVDLANTGLSPGWADVFFIPSPGKVRTVGGEIRLGMHYHYEFGDVHWNILSETADPFSRYLAHELFHYWQESHESDTENLMHSDVSGEHLKKTQWDLAH